MPGTPAVLMLAFEVHARIREAAMHMNKTEGRRMFNTYSARRRALAVMCASLATVVAACSSSASTNNPSGSSKSVTTVTVAVPLESQDQLPLYLAETNGYYKAQGLNIKFVTVPGGNGLSALIGGSAQMAEVTTLRPVTALSQGEQFYNFLAMNIGFAESVIMSTSAYNKAGLTSSSSVVAKIKALANKPLGVISATGENAQVFHYLFKYAGIPDSELDMKVLNSPPAILAAMKSGSIDGTDVGDPYPGEAVAAGYAKYILHLSQGDVPDLTKVVSQTMATSATYYKSNESVVKRFITAYEEATKATYANPDASAEAVYKAYFATTPKSSYMSSFQSVINSQFIAKKLLIDAADLSYIEKYADGAGVSLPSNWKDVFEAP
jgi:sulfonate transport system substrate-binding protein